MPEEIRLYYPTQDGLAKALKQFIDRYFTGEIPNETFKQTIREIAKANPTLVPQGAEPKFSLRMKNTLGKRRLQVLTQVLEEVQ